MNEYRVFWPPNWREWCFEQNDEDLCIYSYSKEKCPDSMQCNTCHGSCFNKNRSQFITECKLRVIAENKQRKEFINAMTENKKVKDPSMVKKINEVSSFDVNITISEHTAECLRYLLGEVKTGSEFIAELYCDLDKVLTDKNKIEYRIHCQDFYI